MITTVIVSFLFLFFKRGFGDAHQYQQIPKILDYRDQNVTATTIEFVNSTSIGPAITATPISSTTAKYHCDYRGEDPDGGIASPFCECGEALETDSWPLLTPSAWIAHNDIFSECAYTTTPVGTDTFRLSKNPMLIYE